MSTSTTRLAAAVSRHSATLKNALRRGRSLTTQPIEDEYSRNVAKAVLSSEKSKAVEQVVTLVVDIARRGTLEDATMIGEQLIAIARAEWAASHTAAVEFSIEEAHLAEERAEGAVEEAEAAMAYHPGSLSHYLTYLRAAAVHTGARRQLDAAVRKEAVRA